MNGGPRLVATLGLCLIVLGLSVPTGAAASEDDYTVEKVTFYSPVLQKDTEMNVALPPGYDQATEPYPVLYYLHGGSWKEDNPKTGLAWILARAKLVGIRDYVIAFPDECYLCNYTNGLTVGNAHVTIDDMGQLQPVGVDSPGIQVGTPWERYFYEDLIPYVESSYNVRTDREGRGLTGHSMGAVATGIFATKHPDLFAYAWAMSGHLHMDPYANEDPLQTDPLELARAAAYGDPVLYEWRWMDYDPYTLSSNLATLAGASMALGVSAGDGNCADDPDSQPGLAPGDLGLDGECRTGYGTEHNRNASTKEFSEHLDHLGVPHELLIYGPALHNQIAPAVDRNFVAAQEAFRANIDGRPQTFQYKNMASSFSIWGYDVRVERPNHEFLYLENVSADSMQVRATGFVRITTARIYEPSRTYAVTIAGSESIVRASSQGRLVFSFRAGPDRLLDQRFSWETDGALDEFPLTSISISPRP